MHRLGMIWLILIVLAGPGADARALAGDTAIHKEIELLKQRIEELEQRLEEQEVVNKRQAVKTEERTAVKIEEAIEERFGTLTLHGGAVLYYQDSRTGELNGADADSPGGAGFAADFELSWKPALPLVEDGEFYARIHAGNGSGADRSGKGNRPADVLLANLNTIADDNSDENDDTGLRLLEAHYTHAFLDGRLRLTGGKAEPLRFLDENAFANDEWTQFVGKPFVNNSVLDSENEFTPMLGALYRPVELLSLSLVGASTSRPYTEDSPLASDAKSKYDNILSTPFLGGQLAVSPKFGKLEGNYRIYGWYASYDHSRLDRRRDFIAGEKDKGWGVGVSADQQLSEAVGIFGRFGWNNEDVYAVQWEASGGLNLKGLVPGREEDEIGLGFAGLVPDSRYAENDPEYHLELYYRFVVTENLALTPDFQYIFNPGGDSRNDGVFAGMLRGQFSF
jgi:hypothetical protein